MRLSPMAEQPKIWSEFLRQRCLVISPHWKAAASLGTIRGKSRDHQEAIRSKGCLQCAAISLPLVLLHQEVEYGAVMPHIKAPARLPVHDIDHLPAYAFSVASKATSGRVDGRLRNVEHRQIGPAAIEQRVDES